jgi:hypothetical protein
MKELKQVFWLVTAFCLVFGAIAVASALVASQAPATPNAPQAQPGQPGQAPGQMPQQQQYPEQPSGQTSPPSGQAAPPSAPQAGQPAQQAPGSQAGSTQQVQTFTGTIVKSGDKYVLQDSTTGTMYDIDHQDLVAQHAGRRVRVTGTLDTDGKTIHLQPSTR